MGYRYVRYSPNPYCSHRFAYSNLIAFTLQIRKTLIRSVNLRRASSRCIPIRLRSRSIGFYSHGDLVVDLRGWWRIHFGDVVSMLKLVDWLLILAGWFWIQMNFFFCILRLQGMRACSSRLSFCKFSIFKDCKYDSNHGNQPRII